MKSRKIIFIAHQFITIKVQELYFLKTFEENGFELEYWEYLPFCKSNLNVPDRLTAPNLYSIASLAELKKKLTLNDPKKTIIISSLHDAFYCRKIFKLLSKNNYTITTIYPYAGVAVLHLSLKDKILRMLSSADFIKKINGFLQTKYYNLYKKIHHIDLSTYWFSSACPYSKVINHPDYEIFKKLQKSASPTQINPYIVFLDTYIPLHHDLITYNMQKYVSVENYQATLRKFFDQIENKFQAEVIIAAHPKAIYNNNEFGSRQIIKYKTGELIKDAKLVITHMSNSTAFAMLFNKPVVFISTSEMDKTPKFAFRLHTFAQHLNKNVYAVDKYNIEQMDFSPIDKEYSEKYIYSYLTTPETENMTNEEILVKEYNAIFDKLG